MTPTTRVRRRDDQLVEALQYTGDNLGQLATWVGGGYRVAETAPGRVAMTREHPPERLEVVAWDWVLNDGQRIYAVRPYDFRSHCREVPVE